MWMTHKLQSYQSACKLTSNQFLCIFPWNTNICWLLRVCEISLAQIGDFELKVLSHEVTCRCDTSPRQNHTHDTQYNMLRHVAVTSYRSRLHPGEGPRLVYFQSCRSDMLQVHVTWGDRMYAIFCLCDMLLQQVVALNCIKTCTCMSQDATCHEDILQRQLASCDRTLKRLSVMLCVPVFKLAAIFVSYVYLRIIWKWQTSSIFVFWQFSPEKKNWHKLRKVYWIWQVANSQTDKPQGECPKRAELPDVNINTGMQSINTERASLPAHEMKWEQNHEW